MNLDSFFQAQAEAQANFMFECEDCGADNVDYWSRGRNAGQARCRSCGNTWMWKDRMKNTAQRSTYNISVPSINSTALAMNFKQESSLDNDDLHNNHDDADDDFQRMLDRVQRGEDPLVEYKVKSNNDIDYNNDNDYYDNDDIDELDSLSAEPEQLDQSDKEYNTHKLKLLSSVAKSEVIETDPHYANMNAWPTAAIQRNSRPMTGAELDSSSESDFMPEEEQVPVKRKRGRPPKNATNANSAPAPRKKPGRPPKFETTDAPLDTPDTPDTANFASLLFPDAPRGKGKENATAPQDVFSEDENDHASYAPNGFEGFSDDEDNGLQGFKLDYPKRDKRAALSIPPPFVSNPSARWNFEQGIGEKMERDHKARYSHFKPRPTNKYNPFLLYNRATRKALSEEHPGISAKELSAMVAQKWKTLDPETKEKYIKEAKESKDAENKARGHRGRNERFPANPYILFSKVMGAKLREDHPEYSIQDTNGLLATKWREMPDEEKQQYREQFKEMKEKFIKENPEYMKERQLKMAESRRRTKLSKQMLQ